MYIYKTIIVYDLALYLEKYGFIIISDIHLGYEESLHRKGFLVSKQAYDDLILRLERTFETIKKKFAIKKIIVNGDIIHEFGKISNNEKILVNKFTDFLLSYGEVILIKGNHDNALKYVVNRAVLIKDCLIFDELLITHGDVLLPKKSLTNVKTIIIGHAHPAITLKSFSKVEKFKCFLKGKYLDKTLVVMPSFNLLIEGTDVLHEHLLSPYLNKTNLLNFETFIVGTEVYDFGKLKNLEK